MQFFSLARSSFLVALFGVFSLVFAGGCRTPYMVEGKVVESQAAHINFVKQAKRDATLIPGDGIAGARVEVIRSPRSLKRKLIASGTSNAQGVFALQLVDFQSNWVQEEWLIRCVRSGHPAIELFDTLPPRNSDIVLVIGLGPTGPASSGDRPLEDDERIRRELERFGR